MKILKLLLIAILISGCSADSDGSKDGTGGSLAVFVLKGNYLYTVDHNALNVFSLSDVAQPSKVNEVFIGDNIETLFTNDEYLFVGSRNGMFIYSIENPEAPVLLSSAQHFTACDPVVANETHSFVTLHSNSTCGNNLNSLMVYDTSDPSVPILIHQKNLVSPKGLGLYGQYLFICDDKIKVFDIADPTNPVLVRTIQVESFDIIIKNDTLYAIAAEGLYRYELNPNNIEEITFKSSIIF